MKQAELDQAIPALNPILQKALGSLDLNLDAELIRYRRQRHISSLKSPKSQPIISETELSAKIHAYLVENELGQQPSNSIKDLKLPQLPETEPEILQSSANIEDPKLTSLVHQISEPEATPNEVVASSNIPPDDYLKSSEQLLENLKPKSEPTATTTENHPFWTYLWTPLGIGSMLLLLLTSLLLGATLITSEQWTRLGLERFLGNNETNPNTNVNTQTTPVPATTTPPQATSNSVDLATQEFITLNLNNLSTLDVNASVKTTPEPQPQLTPQPLPAPNPVVSSQKPIPLPAPVGIPNENTSSLANALLPPSLRPQPVPSYGNVPQITVTSPQALPPIPNLNGNLPSGTTKYYVVIKYNGDRSLQQVQAKIADAYIREFPQGKWIQVGVFAKEQEAKQLQAQLKKNGMNTEIISQN